MAARSGVQDHIRVGSDSVVAASGGVTKDLPSGSLVSNFPARDHRSKLRQDAYTARIGALFDRVKRLERLLSEDS
jgi:UDP-3-O-[3-hydroxymyristoyl] glucosamine N-acyltransferase